MKISTVIIEDERSNSSRLTRLLKNIEPDIEVLTVLESVEDAVQWFATEAHPQLVFMDIQLADGLCFEIFESVSLELPVIFTTAYDEYALKAFKVNSVDYLLKPIDTDELQRAIEKFKRLNAAQKAEQQSDLQMVLRSLKEQSTSYKSRFLVKHRNSFLAIPVTSIAHFTVQNQLVYLHTTDGNKYLMDAFLDHIERMLNPEKFFRINRQSIVHISAIKFIQEYAGSRLKLLLQTDPGFEMIISREKVAAFKSWMDA